MKIVFVAVFTPSSTNVSQANAFRRLGVELVEYDYRAEKAKHGSVDARDTALIELVRKEQPDAVLLSKCSRMGLWVVPELCDTTCCLYWFMDPAGRFRRESLLKAAAAHHSFISRQGALDRLQKVIASSGSDTTASLLCEGFDADVDYPEDIEKKRDYCFIGNLRGDRKRYVKALSIPVIKGRYGHDHSVAVSETRINLNFSEGDGCSDRVYKILAAGGFLLTQPWEGMTDHFLPGRDLVVFNGPAGLKDKIEYYLHNEDERRRIAANGLAKVQQFNRDAWAAEIVKTIERHQT